MVAFPVGDAMRKGGGIVNEFKAFLLRGNVVELAVGIAMGAAFVAVVNSLVADLITPIIAAITGDADFSNLTFSVNDSVFRYGSFINAVITFLTVGTAIFFFVVGLGMAVYRRFVVRPHRVDPEARHALDIGAHVRLADERGAHSERAQVVTERHFADPERNAVPSGPVGLHVAARVEAHPRGSAHRRLHVGAREPDALARQRVDVGRVQLRMPRARQIVPAELVAHDEEDVADGAHWISIAYHRPGGQIDG